MKNVKDIKKENDIDENVDKKAPDDASKNKKSGKYVGFSSRLFLYFLAFSLSLLLCLLLATKSFNYDNPKAINYSENKLIDYKVYLKENDFYEQDYLDKDMIYIASLIDRIALDFKYDFSIETKTNIDFDYKIMGDLVIASPSGNYNYFEKEYVLLDSKSAKMNDNTNYGISENIEIDYDYYNQLANNFKMLYGVDTNSYLKVYLQVNTNSNNSYLDINDSSISSINIPLSQRSVQISFDTNDNNSKKSVEPPRKLVLNAPVFVFEMLSLVVAVIYLSKIFDMVSVLVVRKSAYDKFIDKVLKDYDRLIVETSTWFDSDDYNIINIEKFQELLDVRDNLKLPIMYYNISSHQKSYFYIKDSNDIYLLKVKATDMESKDEKKKKK